MSEIAAAVRTLVEWIPQATAKVVKFIAWWNIAKEYIAMVNMLEPRKHFYEEADQPQDYGSAGGNIGRGSGDSVEGFKARDERFFRLFLWFLANALLAALLR